MTLNEWLIERGMMQKVFAKRIKVSSVTVSLWLTGKRRPRYSTYLRIRKVTEGKIEYEEFFKTKSYRSK